MTSSGPLSILSWMTAGASSVSSWARASAADPASMTTPATRPETPTARQRWLVNAYTALTLACSPQGECHRVRDGGGRGRLASLKVRAVQRKREPQDVLAGTQGGQREREPAVLGLVHGYHGGPGPRRPAPAAHALEPSGSGKPTV